MHEASIAQSILDIVVDTALKNNAKKVTAVNVLIGKLASIEKESLITAFDVLKQDTIANDATLNVQVVAIKGRCLDCGDEGEYEEYYFVCKKCNSINVEIISGEELAIADIEVD
ncbi:MAG: hydrogenase maturation nickel metallochaperone HypA [Calditerrivibrio sp.]|nr:hydrogenase maturation nickel metallochaperone HypA [Calditerrivibrio sp.]